MRKALICSGFAAAFLVATAASAQEHYYDTLSYYGDTLKKAREHCKGDTVVWLNTKTGVYSQLGQNDYGTTEQGRYVCERDVNKQNMMRQQPATTPK